MSHMTEGQNKLLESGGRIEWKDSESKLKLLNESQEDLALNPNTANVDDRGTFEEGLDEYLMDTGQNKDG